MEHAKLDPLMTCDVARELDSTPAWVRILRKRGRLLPRYRTPGGVAIYDRRDVERFVEGRRRGRAARAINNAARADAGGSRR
jgi:hypothetical protein